jgi:hypothetical protein
MSDPYYENVVLLLHGDGVATPSNFADSSPVRKAVGFLGSPLLSADQIKFGDSSIFFPASPNSQLLPPSTTDYQFGAGDFTIEMWIYPLSSAATAYVFNKRTASTSENTFSVERFSGGSVTAYFYYALSGASVDLGIVPNNTWTHIAFTRQGVTLRGFRDGALIASNTTLSTNALNYSTNALVRLGNRAEGTEQFNGYIDELRVTKGVARYTAAFTAPTEPFFGETQPWVLNALQGQQATIMPLALTTPLGQAAVWFTYDPTDGTLTLSGTVKEQGTPNAPLWRRVNLIEQVTGRVIREVWSDATTGAYSFPNIMGGRKYTVVSYDHTGYHRAVIADNLEPV